VIVFNFGLHDLGNNSANYAAYEANLQNFTTRLKADTPKSKLLYVSTTPQMQAE
jgi:hypothetical protein